MSCFEDELFLSPQRTYNYRARLEMVSVDKTHTLHPDRLISKFKCFSFQSLIEL